MNPAAGAENLAYRGMQIDDYDGLIELWRASDGLLLRTADSRAGIDRYLRRNPGLSFVALEAERVVGSIMAGHDGRRGYLQHVAVAADLRRRGIASRLIALSVDALAREDIAKVHVHVAASNRSGRDFWLRRGFHHRPEIELYSFINADDDNA